MNELSKLVGGINYQAEKRPRRDYKRDYLNAKGKIVMLVWFIVFLGAMLAWTIKGNAELSKELYETKGFTAVVR